MPPLPLLHRGGHTWVEASLAPVPMRSWSGHLCLMRDSQAPFGGLLLGHVCIFPHPQSAPTCPFLTLACPGPPQVSSPTLITRAPLHPIQNPRPEEVWQLPPVPRAPFAEGGVWLCQAGHRPGEAWLRVQGSGETREPFIWIRAPLVPTTSATAPRGLPVGESPAHTPA